MTSLAKTFSVQKMVANESLNFNGCEVSQGINRNVRLNTKHYAERIRPIKTSRERKKRRGEMVTLADVHVRYWSIYVCKWTRRSR